MTVFFGDIVGFNHLTSDCTALELIEFLNTFYGVLDNRLKKFRVYQVHNMADEFMIVSGMPQCIGQ